MLTTHRPGTATTAAFALLVVLGAHAGAAGAAASGLGLKAPAGTRSQEDAAALVEMPQAASTLYLGERNMPRLGLQGTESYGGGTRLLGARWASSVEASVTREPILVSPQYALAGRIERKLAPGETLSLGLKMSAFDRAGRVSAGPGSMRLPGEPFADALGYELNMSYFYGNGNRVGVYLQLSPLQGGAASPLAGMGSHAFLLSSEHRLSPKWAMSYDISAPEPGALLRSPNLGLGLRYRF